MSGRILMILLKYSFFIGENKSLFMPRTTLWMLSRLKKNTPDYIKMLLLDEEQTKEKSV
jgi:hypothetical protein